MLSPWFSCNAPLLLNSTTHKINSLDQLFPFLNTYFTPVFLNYKVSLNFSLSFIHGSLYNLIVFQPTMPWSGEHCWWLTQNPKDQEHRAETKKTEKSRNMNRYGFEKTYWWDIECLSPRGSAFIKVIHRRGPDWLCGAQWKSISDDGFIDGIKSHIGLCGGATLAA